MSGIAVRVDTSSFDKLSQRVGAMQMRVARAIPQGLNKGGERVRTQLQRALKQQTNVKAYSSITSRVRPLMAHEGGLQYQIVVKGGAIPIKEFPVHLTLRGVDADTWGVEHLFARSFGIKGEGVEGFRARLGSARFPIRKLKGPNLAKELDRGVVPSVFTFAAREFIPPALLRQLASAL
ncbi:MAG: hypothetical protein ACRYGP_16900 [Janthinobacterium lividum]